MVRGRQNSAARRWRLGADVTPYCSNIQTGAMAAREAPEASPPEGPTAPPEGGTGAQPGAEESTEPVLGRRQRGGLESPDKNERDPRAARRDGDGENEETADGGGEGGRTSDDDEVRVPPANSWAIGDVAYTGTVQKILAPKGFDFDGALVGIPVLQFGAAWARETPPFAGMGPEQLRHACILADVTVSTKKGMWTVTERFDGTVFHRSPWYVQTHLWPTSPVGARRDDTVGEDESEEEEGGDEGDADDYDEETAGRGRAGWGGARLGRGKHLRLLPRHPLPARHRSLLCSCCSPPLPRLLEGGAHLSFQQRHRALVLGLGRLSRRRFGLAFQASTHIPKHARHCVVLRRLATCRSWISMARGRLWRRWRRIKNNRKWRTRANPQVVPRHQGACLFPGA